MNNKIILATLVAAPLLAVALPAQADGNYQAKAMEIVKKDFKPRGQAGLDRIAEDGVQALCNRTGNNPKGVVAKVLESDQMAGIRFPADGKLMGDWKKGEKLAQNGRGFTWKDKTDKPAGGNCYNCHQLSGKEVAYGTVGPSLYQFGKLRGNGPDIKKYVYGKVYNAKAYNLCSEMPRFGHVNALKPDQIKDLVALLLDPESPVNK